MFATPWRCLCHAKEVLKLRLIVTFVAVVSAGILLVGFVFNAVL